MVHIWLSIKNPPMCLTKGVFKISDLNRWDYTRISSTPIFTYLRSSLQNKTKREGSEFILMFQEFNQAT